jgi:Tol biopolymer transport system component
MPESIPNAPESEKPIDDRLNSWKEIAVYLKRDVTTVQRWERREGMPVHRHVHDRMGSVYAFRPELDDWVRSRSLRSSPANSADSALADGTGDVAPDLPPAGEISADLGRPRPGNRLPLLLLVAAAGLALAITSIFWLRKTEYFWTSPIAGARFQTVAESEGAGVSAAISHDGHFVALLSDRGGKTDVWVTQVGSGAFHNLTQGSISELVNPSIRTLGFSPDDSLVTFWVRKQNGSSPTDISIWAVPTLGGTPKPYLEGVAEFDWSHDGSRLAYHTPAAGDPLFVSDGHRPLEGTPIFTAPAGAHAHFPVWAPDSSFIYFVSGVLPDKLDIWRIHPAGHAAERMTSLNTQMTYPVFLDRHTLLYLARDSNGAGPWLYSMDVDRRIPHQLGSGLDRYTSLAASADGRRLLFTVASPRRSLWHLQIPASLPETSAPAPINLTTTTGFSPRLGPNYLLYISSAGEKQSIWKLSNGVGSELWNTTGAQIIDGPAISPDGHAIAFSVRQQKRSLLYVMHDDGTNARVVADSLNLQGAPAWEPDGKSITSAVDVQGTPQLFRIPVDGRPPVPFVKEYSVDPAWTPDGQFVVYSGPDIGTAFSVKASAASAAAHPLPDLTLTRGARHLAFLLGGKKLAVLRGEINHKNLWLLDMETGAGQQLTNLPADFDVRDFDVSPDGNEVVLERVQERSDLMLMDLPN